MKSTDKAKLGLGVIGVGIIGYGLYSMKKDTEKLIKTPGSFLDGLFGGGRLGGSGLPGAETEPVNSGNTIKKFLDDITGPDSLYGKLFIKETKTGSSQMGTNVDEIKTYQQALSLGLGMAPLAVNTQSDFKKSSDIYFPVLETSPATKYTEKTSIKPNDTIFDVKKSLDVNVPMAGANPATKYTEKTSSGSSSSSYTDSTGRVYTPTNTIKAKW